MLKEKSGSWKDIGTGHIQIVYRVACRGMAIVVRPENGPEDAGPLLMSKVHSDDIYHHQEDTLIVWNEPNTDMDVAISFQEEQGCVEIMDLIRALQKSPPLPRVTLDNLTEVEEAVCAQLTPASKEQLVMSLQAESYISKVLDLFDDLVAERAVAPDEDSRLRLDLLRNQLYRIVRGFVAIGDVNLLEVMFAEEYAERVLFVLTHDPDVLPAHRVPVPTFPTINRRVREAVPALRSNALLQKIAQTQRIKYVKDVSLARFLDDQAHAALGSMVYFNQMEVVSTLQDGEAFLRPFFHLLRTDRQVQVQLVSLFHELIGLAKVLPVKPKETFFSELARWGMYDVIATLIGGDIDSVAHAQTVSILNTVILSDPPAARRHLVIPRTMAQPPSASSSPSASTTASSSSPSSTSSTPPLPTTNESTPVSSAATTGGAKKRERDADADAGDGSSASPAASPDDTGRAAKRHAASDDVRSTTPSAGDSPSPSSHEAPARVSLLRVIVRCIAEGEASPVEAHLTECLRALVDPESTMGDTLMGPLLDEFYTEGVVDQLVVRLRSPPPPQSAGASARFDRGTLLVALLNLLATCFDNHGQRAVAFASRSGVLEAGAALCESDETHVAAAGVRFVRRLIGSREPFYEQEVERRKLLLPVFRAFRRQNPSRNVLSSTVLELVDFLTSSQKTSLIQHAVAEFSDEYFADISYVGFFQQLMQRAASLGPASTEHPQAMRTLQPVAYSPTPKRSTPVGALAGGEVVGSAPSTPASGGSVGKVRPGTPRPEGTSLVQSLEESSKIA